MAIAHEVCNAPLLESQFEQSPGLHVPGSHYVYSWCFQGASHCRDVEKLTEAKVLWASVVAGACSETMVHSRFLRDLVWNMDQYAKCNGQGRMRHLKYERGLEMSNR
jgi:hypothetical protein